MRRLGRNRVHAEEEESVFVTMTDMTISFLLIIMILLAFFATQLNDDDSVPMTAFERVRQERDELRVENQDLRTSLEALEAELSQVRAERHQLLEENDRLRAASEALEAEIALVQTELTAVTVERDQLLDEVNRLRSENEILNAELALLQSDLELIRSERDGLRGELEQMNAENEALRERISELEAEIERLGVINPLEAYLSQAIDQRRELLVELRDRLRLEFPDLQVVISPEQDALRFQGEGLFRSGSSLLEPRQRVIVETMGRLLDEILVCFTLGERAERGADCGSRNALIEAVQIEGHTDSDGTDLNNLRLSTDRANATLLVMLDEDRTILSHENLRGQPVMSVSGYGEMRPIEPNETSEGKAANRRIDLRIIMYAPSTVEEVEEVSRRLDALRAAGGSE